MLVIIDSTEFVKNPYALGRSWELLAQWTDCEDVLIAMPQIVFDEAARHFLFSVNEIARNLDRDLKRMVKLLPQHTDWKFPAIHFDDTENGYRTALLGRLVALRIQLTDHNGAVATSNSRTVKGTLIWQMALRHLAESTESVTIITNTGEFGTPGELAKDLLADLEKRRLDAGRVRIYKSRQAILRNHVVPRMKGLKKLTAAVDDDRHPIFDLNTAFSAKHEYIVDWVKDFVERDGDAPSIFNTATHGSPQLAYLSEVPERFVTDVYLTEDSQVTFFLWCKVDGVVRCKRKDQDEYIEGRVTFEFDVIFTFDSKTGEVENPDFDSTFWYQPWPEDWPSCNESKESA